MEGWFFKQDALGGQAIWNGQNYNGQKVSSGVYPGDSFRRKQYKNMWLSKIFFVR